MAKHKYNGVALPAPPAYDTKAYPYASTAVDNVGMYYFDVYDSEPYYQEGWLRFTRDGNGLFWTYDPESGSNSWNGPFETSYTANDTRTAPFWANFNVKDENGDVWLPQSAPAVAFDLNSFLKGLALGLAGKPLEFAPWKEPVAYLYNGVRLPQLPERDKEKYPYAFISVGGRYLNFVSDDCITAHSDGYLYNDEDIRPVTRYKYTDGEWVCTMLDGGWNYGTLGKHSDLVWANFDVLNEDGTLYLAASEPVPVYE